MIIPIIIAVDLLKVGNAAYNDAQNSTTRQTVETTAEISSGWIGGYTGKNYSLDNENLIDIDLH